MNATMLIPSLTQVKMLNLKESPSEILEGEAASVAGSRLV